MKSLVVKRSVVVAGHKTSVSLEDAFWNGEGNRQRAKHYLVGPSYRGRFQAAAEQSVIGHSPLRTRLLSQPTRRRKGRASRCGRPSCGEGRSRHAGSVKNTHPKDEGHRQEAARPYFFFGDVAATRCASSFVGVPRPNSRLILSFTRTTRPSPASGPIHYAFNARTAARNMRRTWEQRGLRTL